VSVSEPGVGPVPFAIDPAYPDRIPKERYVDAEFFRLEAEQLWGRTWQMACRLEEIPRPDDFATYEILGDAITVVRTEDLGVQAFDNSCRHRGVRLTEGRGSCGDGFTCPFHGWTYAADGRNTKVPRKGSFAEHNRAPADELDLPPVRCEIWGGCAWINLDPDAPPVRTCLEPAATALEAWKVESLRAEWWYACSLPVNWKLAIEAFIEAYHVTQAHPQLVIPTRHGLRQGETFDPRAFVEADLEYLRAMNEGMAGMVHASDLRVAEGMADIELPAEPELAMATWNRQLNDAVTTWHRDRGHDVPDLDELTAAGFNKEFFHGFPSYVVLPMYSSASSYRFRPLGPEETLMEVWSLTRFAEGEEPDTPPVPEVWSCDDPRWPTIPAQDFSNLPKQQKGLHAASFEYMRLSEQLEGHISNFQRLIDGFLAGRSQVELVKGLGEVNTYPFDRPVVDLGF
jgi:phenylpropionate dioxygenase-like ring-hydroxylating dioxygenase large terminal subunit